MRNFFFAISLIALVTSFYAIWNLIDDGYDKQNSSYKDYLLHKETQDIIDLTGSFDIVSLTPSSYQNIKVESIYSKIYE